MPNRARNRDRREPRLRFLIVCEGQETEPNYLKGFQQKLRLKAQLKIIGGVGSPMNVARKAIYCKNQREYDYVWCVFDRDSFADFTQAIQKAKNHDIQVAYSNPVFELWFVLHFAYRDTAANVGGLEQQLTNSLGQPYEKNDPSMYEKLSDKQLIAIEHAERLLQSCGPHHNPANDNPCTTVHQLVETLNAHART